MKSCFVHKNIEHEKSCPFCSKDYCNECLMLVGKRKTVICKTCYHHYMEKINKSKFRRYIYIFAGLVIVVPLFMNAFEAFRNESANATLFILIGGLVLLSITLNTVRLMQFKNWTIKEEYPPLREKNQEMKSI